MEAIKEIISRFLFESQITKSQMSEGQALDFALKKLENFYREYGTIKAKVYLELKDLEDMGKSMMELMSNLKNQASIHSIPSTFGEYATDALSSWAKVYEGSKEVQYWNEKLLQNLYNLLRTKV